jgi:dGTPase
MEWMHLLAGATHNQDQVNRTVFDRDFDRIIFSDPFRRLQDKTQVHPLPEQDFVHTRLTHSLEVSSVGRSLGREVGTKVLEKHPILKEQFSAHDFGAIVAAAALAHDIGNPPFGHSGEEAISAYFKENTETIMGQVSDTEWADLISFEGNAQGFRLLNKTGHEGLKLSAPTLAAFTKYPRPAKIENKDKTRRSQKKFGYYQSEKEIFKSLEDSLEMLQFSPTQWGRHPLAFLVEAADDICYHIIDLEDGCNLGLISLEETVQLYAAILGEKFNPEKLAKLRSDKEKVGVLRALSISELIDQCVTLFMAKEEQLLSGEFDQSFADVIPAKDALGDIISVSIDKIYRCRTVLEKEATGYEVLYGLLEVFCTPVLENFNGEPTHRSKTFFRLLPKETQQEIKASSSVYEALRAMLDYIASMTDSSAIGLFRKVKGISLPGGR